MGMMPSIDMKSFTFSVRMHFLKVIGTITRQLDAEGVRYALIGGFAMALRGVQRATVDLDFILMLEDYLTLFKLGDKLHDLKDWYGTAD